MNSSSAPPTGGPRLSERSAGSRGNLSGLKPPISASDIPCRNIQIYGYCKYADEGCMYNHDQMRRSAASVGSADSANSTGSSDKEKPKVSPGSIKSRLNGMAPAFAPPNATLRAKMSPNLAEIPAFVPSSRSAPLNSNTESGKKFNFDSPAFTPGQSMTDVTALLPPPRATPAAPPRGSFFPAAPPLNHHLYAPLPPYLDRLAPYERSVAQLFLPNDIGELLRRKAEATLQTVPGSQLPELVHVYCDLVPLDRTLQRSAACFGHIAAVYKAFSVRDGRPYCLRRIANVTLPAEQAIHAVKPWSGVTSSCVVRLHEAFTTRAFGDNSLVFVYDYYPLSVTLAEQMAQRKGGPVSEELFWAFVVQLSAGLTEIHSRGLAARCVEASKVIATSGNKIKLGACGVFDVLRFGTEETARSVEERMRGVNLEENAGQKVPMAELQKRDLHQLGALMLKLLQISSPEALNGGAAAAEFVEKLPFAAPIVASLKFLLVHSAEDGRGISEFNGVIAEQAVRQFDLMTGVSDRYEALLMAELENSRLVRLLCKLGLVNERPEFDYDPAWSETGDRYLLKLFRDYVFHQVDENGKPVVDLGHILRCLNKLDAGVDEKILLVSRDQKNCLIVSYKELKDCVESAVRDLLK